MPLSSRDTVVTVHEQYWELKIIGSLIKQYSEVRHGMKIWAFEVLFWDSSTNIIKNGEYFSATW